MRKIIRCIVLLLYVHVVSDQCGLKLFLAFFFAKYEYFCTRSKTQDLQVKLSLDYNQ